jgi:hypothetical protein
MLVVDEDAVQTKKAELTESFNKDKKAYETKIAKLQAQLNESMKKTQKLNDKIDSFKAMELLESKTKDLPTFEARKMKKRFADATAVEIEKNFSRVLESVQKEIKEEEKDDEVTLEEEIKDIIESDEEVKENDYLKGRKHNGHIDEAEDDEEKPVKEAEEPYETMESFKFDKYGDVILESEDIIDAEYMKSLCMMAERIK